MTWILPHPPKSSMVDNIELDLQIAFLLFVGVAFVGPISNSNSPPALDPGISKFRRQMVGAQ